MTTRQQGANYRIARLSEIEPVDCPCGLARRAFGDDPEGIATLHVVDIRQDTAPHYHKKLTEIYYILEGTGQVELDGRKYDVAPGDAILIKPGCRHRALGAMKIINVPIPAFDPADEWFDAAIS